jgi:hypothetical protein
MTSPAPAQWRRWIVMSYARAVGEPLCAPSDLDDCHRVVLCHDTADDPVFVYANHAAVLLWERPLLGTPSRLTAPPEARSERAAALSSGTVVRGYSGVRIAASGRRFRILEATVWPVTDAQGAVRGQAAAFDRTEPVEG